MTDMGLLMLSQVETSDLRKEGAAELFQPLQALLSQATSSISMPFLKHNVSSNPEQCQYAHTICSQCWKLLLRANAPASDAGMLRRPDMFCCVFCCRASTAWQALCLSSRMNIQIMSR